ncbi:hypothetical protein BDV95DRAFT_281536 [Massariosphaeria phaeospora]|uniref:Uncharacterized protein n=1 Tax=Massariosphaeria phaeospora TaxID=100035 RepID=A0A7C8MFP3_9PLEO|nr:hypothetical protein BDV95DRAFT_281536 [Massariosphaeria phaeospora]
MRGAHAPRERLHRPPAAQHGPRTPNKAASRLALHAAHDQHQHQHQRQATPYQLTPPPAAVSHRRQPGDSLQTAKLITSCTAEPLTSPSRARARAAPAGPKAIGLRLSHRCNLWLSAPSSWPPTPSLRVGRKIKRFPGDCKAVSWCSYHLLLSLLSPFISGPSRFTTPMFHRRAASPLHCLPLFSPLSTCLPT